MEVVVVIGVGLLLCGWAFTAGKREGSRKGFNAGVHKAKRYWKKWFRRD